MADEAAGLQREARARRQLRAQGYQLVKSRARDGRAPDFGGYMIVNAATNFVEAGELGGAMALDLDQVEAFIRAR